MKKRNIAHWIAWIVYMLLFYLVLTTPNELMTITETDGSPGEATVGVVMALEFFFCCILFVGFDLFLHLFVHHPKFRLSAIILLLLGGIWNTYKFYYIFSNYEAKRISEDIVEVVPDEGCLSSYWEISSCILLYLIVAMGITYLVGMYRERY